MKLSLFLISGVSIALIVPGILCKRTRSEKAQELFDAHKSDLEDLKNLAESGGHSSPDSIVTFDPDVCYTRDCIEAANEILSATNFKEDPCQDGSWLKFVCVRRTLQTEGSDELNDINQQSQVGYLGSVALGQSLALLETMSYPSPAMQMAVTYHQQCENWRESDNQTKINEVLSFLNMFGEWPMLTGNDSPGDNFDWKTMMANVVRIVVAYGAAPYLFDIFLEDDKIPLIFTGELNLHKDDSEIAEVIRILSNGERVIPENDTQILEMRDFMANLTHPAEDKIGSSTIKEITEKNDLGDFDLVDFYKKMLAGTSVQVTPESEVVADVEWMVNHINSVNGADPRIIANILFLQTASALLTRLTTMTHGQHLPTLQKYRSDGPLDCLRETYEKFDYAMSHEFIRRYYNHNGTAKLVQLLDDLKDGYAETIKQANFLTSQTQVHAVDKAQDIHTFIAADSWVMDAAKLKEYYANMNVSNKENFVRNHVEGLRFHWAKFLELTNANIFNYLVGDAYTGYVSAKYSYHFNQLRIQAALVQKPLFSSKYPGFMNYGGIGTVISHTLGHSFDTNGVHFNKAGHRGDFWDDLSYDGYYNWTNTVVDDYSQDEYKKPDPWGSTADGNIDHVQTVNDDIADIVGVHMAYRAYQKHLEDLKKDGKAERVLPGLKELSANKLFWMKYANTWCEHAEKSYLHAMRHFNMHSPGNIRATLPISRSKQWAQDFGCPAPSKSDF